MSKFSLQPCQMAAWALAWLWSLIYISCLEGLYQHVCVWLFFSQQFVLTLGLPFVFDECFSHILSSLKILVYIPSFSASFSPSWGLNSPTGGASTSPGAGSPRVPSEFLRELICHRVHVHIHLSLSEASGPLVPTPPDPWLRLRVFPLRTMLPRLQGLLSWPLVAAPGNNLSFYVQWGPRLHAWVLITHLVPKPMKSYSFGSTHAGWFCSFSVIGNFILFFIIYF